MTQEEKAELQTAIEQKIAKTKKDIADYKEMTKPVAPDVAIGRISRMDAINNKSVLEASLREAESKLIRLKNALQKINDESFGICIKCHHPIPYKRMLIIPDSVKCVGCFQ
ncbi:MULTISPECIES: TraR/DksA C4-type zinc finger protein [Bacteroidota]|uniref:DksA/traR C4-type zinc finger family protein n=2 Tax=Weeksellaceae TaxID=2762318 RepID=A0A511NH03_9FLAO|nr:MULTISPECIES: TraR/DksA C4-type zinc finger protein [Bacteroidota]MDV3664689.1 TraR/DksA family transcriptional regulator [Elizabethkingia anophelis]MDE5528823.1 TraR/DksA C4-type zinc finger protein [Elizabethkingia meningoseptica]MDE5532379.1 TraR/DksA C4-type zinc finger protein [Elizabethkingia meningoseptica]MDE5540711.1 TraR/DksA C4-type zinc finger protein [Elizabethkingia meningoseptica]MEC5144538.1 Transcriptional regulator, TraR/DksA family [Chitinophaga sp. 212800010-3]